MKIIVGLGNPGVQYKETRHNVGFLALDEMARAFGGEFKTTKNKAEAVEVQIGTEKVILIKPQTFMNLSGQAVAPLASFYKVDPQDIIAIYDDVDIKNGDVRLRQGGSAAGHNGIKSMIKELGSDDFIRVRIGVAPIEPFQGDLADYVLGRITDEEWDGIKKIIDKTPSIIESLLAEGVEESMQKYN